MADLSPVPSSVKKSSSGIDARQKLGGEALERGNLLALVSNKLYLASATEANSKTAIVGIALNDGGEDQPVAYVTKDDALDLGITIAPGTPLYASATSGKIATDLADLSPGDIPIIIGMGVADNKVSVDFTAIHKSSAALVA